MPPYPASRRLAVFSALAGATVLAQAQQTQQIQAAAPAANPLTQVEIKGATASYDARRDDTAMKFTLERADIERYGDSNLFDLLKRIPGITVASTNGRDGTIQMRGLGRGYTQVLVDGERTPPGFSMDTLAPDLIERIEVMRAPTAEFSTQSMAGTINIVLRRAVRKTERKAKLGYLLASDFKGPTATLDLADRGDKFSYSLAANANHDRLYRPDVYGIEEIIAPDGTVDTRRRTAVPERGRMNRFSVNPKLNWNLDGGDTLAWGTLVNGSRFRNGARALVTTEAGRAPPVPDLRSAYRADDTSLRSELAWTHAFGSGATLDMKIGVEGMERNSRALRYGMDGGTNGGNGGSSNGAGLPVTDGRIDVDTRDRGVKSTGKYQRKLDSGHALTFGWDGGVNKREDARVERDAIRPLPPNLSGDESFDARITRLALYGQDEWHIDAAWSAYAGVRWEGIRTCTSGNTFDAARSRSSVFSPLAQVLWKIPDSKGSQLRLAISRTYKAPELDSLVPKRQTWENNSATEADYQGNPDLKPELAWGLDAAWEHYWAEGAMFSISASMRRISDIISNRVYFDGYRWIFTPSNVERADTRGIELETRFPLKTLVADAPALDLRASASRNWSRVPSVPGPDNRVGEQLPLSAQVGMDYTGIRVTTGASFAFKSASPQRTDVDRWLYSPARRDLEAYALWKASPKLQLRVALSNLLSQDAGFEVRYMNAAGGLEKRRWTYPGGVQLRTTLEATF